MAKVKKEKKKSRTKIGNESESERESMLIEDGFVTHKTQMARGWEQNKDMFNMFDILGFKKPKILLSQVKTTNLLGCIEEIRAWILKNKHLLPENLEIEVALKKHASKTKPIRWNIYQIPLDENMPVTHYVRGGLEEDD